MKRPRRRRAKRDPWKPRQKELLGPTIHRGGAFSEALALNPKSGKLERDTRVRPTRWTGAQVNEPRPLPKSPDPQLVDQTECTICGERYRDWSGSGCDITDIEPTGPFKSRGTLLWSLRVCKMGEWYKRHLACLEWWSDPEFRRLRLPDSAIWELIHGEGCVVPGSYKLTPRQQRWIEAEGLVCYAPDEDLGF